MRHLLADARNRVRKYDAQAKAKVRYNPAATYAYHKLAVGHIPRGTMAWLALERTLLAFDMGRQIGGVGTCKLRTSSQSLRNILSENALVLRPLLSVRLSVASVRRHRAKIARLFDLLAKCDGVVAGKRFPVGATKVLHFLNPELFQIIDKRVAETLRSHQPALPRTATQYTGLTYVTALYFVAQSIRKYGQSKLWRIQSTQPTLRIVDKVLFM